jgi:uncharacterized protein (DUF111 family)
MDKSNRFQRRCKNKVVNKQSSLGKLRVTEIKARMVNRKLIQVQQERAELDVKISSAKQELIKAEIKINQIQKLQNNLEMEFHRINNDSDLEIWINYSWLHSRTC